MFDPQEYFGRIERLLSSCSSWADPVTPTLEVTYDSNRKWSMIIWRFETSFANGCRFIAIESHSWRSHKHYRKIKYRLMDDKGVLVFQVDPHESPIPFDDVPHLHIGPTEKLRFKDGDWKLNGLSLRDFDFIKMWDLVQKYVTDGSVPWRT